MKRPLSGTGREKIIAVVGIVLALLATSIVVAVAETVDPFGGASGPRPPAPACEDLLPPDANPFLCDPNGKTPAELIAGYQEIDTTGTGLVAVSPTVPSKRITICHELSDLAALGQCGKGGQTICQPIDGQRQTWQCYNSKTRQYTTHSISAIKQVCGVGKGRRCGGLDNARADMGATRGVNSAPTEIPVALPSDRPSTQAPTTPDPTAMPTQDPQPSAGENPEVAQAIAAASQQQLRVWLEADLTAAWAAGRTVHAKAVAALVRQAKSAQVIGVNFADSLAFTGWQSAADVRQFMLATSRALRAALPGKRIAVSVIVPELGCGSSLTCVTAMRQKYPLVTKDNVSGYLAGNVVDNIYVATGLLRDDYAKHQISLKGKSQRITPAIAAEAQWLMIKALGWDAIMPVGAREYGFAHQTDRSTWDTARAKIELDTRVRGPIVNHPVGTVTLWAHRSTADARIWRLFDVGLADNAVTEQLAAEPALRNRVGVLFDPTDVEVGIAADLAQVARVAGEVFIITR